MLFVCFINSCESIYYYKHKSVFNASFMFAISRTARHHNFKLFAQKRPGKSKLGIKSGNRTPTPTPKTEVRHRPGTDQALVKYRTIVRFRAQLERMPGSRANNNSFLHPAGKKPNKKARAKPWLEIRTTSFLSDQ